MTGALGTIVWPLEAKNSRNDERISREVMTNEQEIVNGSKIRFFYEFSFERELLKGVELVF
jgi:hypothetical protein